MGTSGIWWASLSIVQLLMLAAGERGCGDGSIPYVWPQQYRLAFVAAQLPPTGISHHHLLPYIPSICLSTVNYRPHPGFTPQSLNSNCHLLCLPGTCNPVWCMYSCGKTVWFSFHLGCQRSAVLLSTFIVSPLTQTVAMIRGLDPWFSSPTCWGQVQSY